MYTEHAIPVWSSLVSRLPLLSLSETQVLVVFLNVCTNHRKDFLTPWNVEKKVSNMYSNFRFPVNLFAEVEDHSFSSVWPLIRDRLIVLLHAILTLWRVFNNSLFKSSDDLNGFKIEICLFRDNIGVYSRGLGDVPLCSTLEGPISSMKNFVPSSPRHS